MIRRWLRALFRRRPVVRPHIRNERETALRFGNGDARHCITWCGIDASNEWYFDDMAHVLSSKAFGGRREACAACLEAMVTYRRQYS